MTQAEFDNTKWCKGMKARILVHTFSVGIITRICDITGVDFESGRISLRSEDTFRPYHRYFNEVELWQN